MSDDDGIWLGNLESQGIAAIVQSLTDRLAHAPTIGEALADGSDLLLDLECGGYRCLVMRTPEQHRPMISLSPREQEIARMVAKGYPNKTIAAVLEISTWTVGTHLRRIFAKLGVSSRAAMVAKIAESNGLPVAHGNAG